MQRLATRGVLGPASERAVPGQSEGVGGCQVQRAPSARDRLGCRATSRLPGPLQGRVRLPLRQRRRPHSAPSPSPYSGVHRDGCRPQLAFAEIAPGPTRLGPGRAPWPGTLEGSPRAAREPHEAALPSRSPTPLAWSWTRLWFAHFVQVACSSSCLSWSLMTTPSAACHRPFSFLRRLFSSSLSICEAYSSLSICEVYIQGSRATTSDSEPELGLGLGRRCRDGGGPSSGQGVGRPGRQPEPGLGLRGDSARRTRSLSPGPPRPILAGGQPSDPGPGGAASSSAGAESGRLGLARRPGANECHGEPLAAHPVTLSPTRKLLRCRSPSQTASVCHAAGLELRIRSDRVGRFTSWRPGLPADGPGPLPRLLSPPPEPEEPGRS